MEMDPKLIGERIKLAREAKNLTAKGLGEYVGLSEATISRYESGIVAKIKLPVLQELAKRLDVSEEYLFGVSDTPHQKIRIVPQSQYPYVPDAVAAGIPETLEGMSELPKITLPDESLGRYAGRRGIIIMRVNGDSMNNVIQNGALVAVDTRVTAHSLRDGDMVVFNHSYEYSLKRFYKAGDKLIFRPDSSDPSFTDIVYSAEDEISIVGKVVMSINKYE